MKRPFALTAAATALTLDARGRGRLAITVSSTRERPVTARAKVVDESPTPAGAWVHLDEEQVFGLAPLASRQLTLVATADPRIPAGTYLCHVAVWDEDTPDEDYVDGPAIAITVPSWPAVVKRGFPWLLILLILLALVALVAPWVWATHVTDGWLHRVRVPNVTGLDTAQANDLLGPTLLVGAVSEVASSPRPLGCIVAQDPPAGSVVPQGSSIALTVHGGILVPDLTGQIPGKAKQVLTASKLALGTTTTVVEASAQPIGSIIRQTPTKRTPVAASTAVDVTVLGGVAVPDLNGTTLDFARSAVATYGLVCAVADGPMQRKDGLEKPTVTTQTPAPGTQLVLGGTITVTVVYPPETTP
jgi:beta-lactam-binding protein with PASTA domain